MNAIVVGDPLELDGRRGIASEAVRIWLKKFLESTEVRQAGLTKPVFFWDERFSTVAIRRQHEIDRRSRDFRNVAFLKREAMVADGRRKKTRRRLDKCIGSNKTPSLSHPIVPGGEDGAAASYILQVTIDIIVFNDKIYTVLILSLYPPFFIFLCPMLLYIIGYFYRICRFQN